MAVAFNGKSAATPVLVMAAGVECCVAERAGALRYAWIRQIVTARNNTVGRNNWLSTMIAAVVA
jgi:hypothetical protein